MKLITLFKRGRNIITAPQYHQSSPDVLPIALKCLNALCMRAFRTMFCMSCPSAGLKRTVLMKKVSNILALHMPCLSIKAFNKRELHERLNVFHLLLCISFLLSDQNTWGTWCYSMKSLEFLFILSPRGRSRDEGRCQVSSWASSLALFCLKSIKECLFIILVIKYLIPPRWGRD